ncbi:MAG: YceI family protein [Myxococcales bacterium]|nr:MAG: YceI family protein [Myxococcales bacterium]
MKYVTRLSLVIAAWLALPAVSHADPTTFRIGGDGKSRATFVSDAPLETMTGKTSKVTGTLTVDPIDITKTTGKFKVPVKSIRTGSDLRDEHLQGDGWLDAKKNPFIHFEISEVVLGKRGNKELKRGKDTKVEVKGKFTAHGVTQYVTAKGTVNWSGEAIQIKASFPYNLTDHEISVPSIVRLKVANVMTASVDLRGGAK